MKKIIKNCIEFLHIIIKHTYKEMLLSLIIIVGLYSLGYGIGKGISKGITQNLLSNQKIAIFTIED